MEATGATVPAGLRQGVPLSEFTTWKVGGPAEWFAEPASREELIALAAWAVGEGIPYRCIGAGSNLLIADAGLAGLTLCNRRLQGSQLDGGEGWVLVRLCRLPLVRADTSAGSWPGSSRKRAESTSSGSCCRRLWR